MRGLRLRSGKATPSPDALPDAVRSTDRLSRLAAVFTRRLLPLSAGGHRKSSTVGALDYSSGGMSGYSCTQWNLSRRSGNLSRSRRRSVIVT